MFREIKGVLESNFIKALTPLLTIALEFSQVANVSIFYCLCKQSRKKQYESFNIKGQRKHWTTNAQCWDLPVSLLVDSLYC